MNTGSQNVFFSIVPRLSGEAVISGTELFYFPSPLALTEKQSTGQLRRSCTLVWQYENVSFTKDENDCVIISLSCFIQPLQTLFVNSI